MARSVILRSQTGTICRIRCDRRLQSFAMRWSYVARQRGRWSGNRQAQKQQSERLRKELREVGVQASDLKKLAHSGVVEVRVPFTEEGNDWEARVLPWEHVLTAATRQERDGIPLVVIRHLDRGNSGRPKPPQSLALVQSAPGVLGQRCDFGAAASLIRSSLPNLESCAYHNPTAAELQQGFRSMPPDVVHLTGVDVHRGRRLLGVPAGASRDGVYLSSGPADTDCRETHAQDLAALLNHGNPSPRFIGFHLWNSGSRIAPLAVAAGADAAIGFQHTFDDAVAENFFVSFYRACQDNHWDYLTGFMNAWNSVAGYRNRIRGSSIILWSAKSLVGAASYDELRQRVDQRRVRRQERLSQARDADPAEDRIQDLVQVTVSPRSQLNYSLLHNGSSVLEELKFRFVANGGAGQPPDSRPAVRAVRDIDVTVSLHVGSDTFPWRTRVAVGQEVRLVDLACPAAGPDQYGNPTGGVRLPLTSLLIRSVSERIQTSLFVEATWHGQTLYRHTHPVWLSPVDQWSLSDDDIQWLPSFVQPRDAAVAQTIASAQKYLCCLADYGAVGFDGYQSFRSEGASENQEWAGVDRQVQAIWSALVFDQRLAYINPPPSYADRTQRLRTPGQVLAEGRGTCIDLAILVASCLEWIEIYPVIFMLQGHAFPGYWRSLEAYYQFVDVKSPPTQTDERRSQEDLPTPAWISGRTTYQELKTYVDAGDLVPLESVLMTQGAGFRDTREEGRSLFSGRRCGSFHSMVDIVGARSKVTPLPLSE